MNRTEDDDEEDRRIEQLLDAVDERTKIQTKLHDALSNGFMWIARERYRDALATYQLQNVVSDAREMQSNVRVNVDDVRNVDDTRVSFTKWEDDDVCPHGDNDNNGDDEDTVNETSLDSGIRRRRHSQQRSGASTTGSQSIARTDDDDVEEEEEEEEEEDSSVSKAKTQMNGRRRRPTVMAMPSKEVREAMRCFNESIAHAIRLASENSTLAQVTSS